MNNLGDAGNSSGSEKDLTEGDTTTTNTPNAMTNANCPPINLVLRMR